MEPLCLENKFVAIKTSIKKRKNSYFHSEASFGAGLMGEGRPGRENEQRQGKERVPPFLSIAHGLIITYIALFCQRLAAETLIRPGGISDFNNLKTG